MYYINCHYPNGEVKSYYQGINLNKATKTAIYYSTLHKEYIFTITDKNNNVITKVSYK